MMMKDTSFGESFGAQGHFVLLLLLFLLITEETNINFW